MEGKPFDDRVRAEMTIPKTSVQSVDLDELERECAASPFQEEVLGEPSLPELLAALRWSLLSIRVFAAIRMNHVPKMDPPLKWRSRSTVVALELSLIRVSRSHDAPQKGAARHPRERRSLWSFCVFFSLEALEWP